MDIMGTFQYEDDAISAAEGLHAAGIKNVSLMSPIPMHAAEKALGLGKSNVRKFTLIGAILGGLGGFAMCVATALVFIMPTGGRAVVALPPYLLITYETTILIGVLSTLAGFFLVAKLPAWKNRPYRTEANVNRFVVAVENPSSNEAKEAEQIIQQAGALGIEQTGDTL